MKNKLITVFIATLVLLAGISAVSADETNFKLGSVFVDELSASESEPVFVERGQDAIIEVFLTGEGAGSDDVRVKAYIGGYEHDDVEAATEVFEVEPGVKYRKVLRLAIPDDLEVEESYTLRVKLYDDNEEDTASFLLRIKEPRHSVVFQDVIVRPSSVVEAGRPVFVTVRAENLGFKKEEDVKVTVSIPTLGVSERTYIDELAAAEVDNEDEEDSMSSDELLLSIPDNAATGSYELVVTLEFNRGHNTISYTELISVKGMEQDTTVPQEPADKVIVSTDSTSKTTGIGKEAAYRVMIANLGMESKLFTVETEGEQIFADSSVVPAFVTIPAESNGEVVVYITPQEGATEGRHSFTLRVKSGTEIVSEISLTTTVEAVVAVDDNEGSGFDGDLKQALIIGVVVLVVVLIILGLIVAFSRMRGDEELGTGEGQSYYYYPKI
ncbi:MAG: hypothetical protein AABW49_03205 [Nanoarchaeota archaeon]